MAGDLTIPVGSIGKSIFSKKIIVLTVLIEAILVNPITLPFRAIAPIFCYSIPMACTYALLT
jgi:accessory gene regulator protein AgrB